MIPSESTTPDLVRLLRALRTLLALTVCLLTLLVLGLGVGAFWAMQRVAELEAVTRQQADVLQRVSVELAQEATRRQEGLSAGLVDRSQTTRARIAELTARRQGLAGHPANPLAKLDRGLDINVLVADELLLLLRHLAESQETVGRSLRPLPKQRELSPRGSGR